MLRQCSLLLLLAGLTCTAARADSVSVVNFDNYPQGPSFFVQAGPAQTIAVSGVATFTGGVILGNASNFPANIYATNPNTYSTADFGDNLSNTLKIAVAPTNLVNEVSFALFNGENAAESYVVKAFSGSSLIASETFLNLPGNLTSGYVLPDLKGAGITSLTIAPLSTAGGWDYLIDTVAFNESVQKAVTPEPSSLVLLLTGMSGGLGVLYRRARRIA